MGPRYDGQVLPAPPSGGVEDNEGSLLVGYVPTRRYFTAPGTSVRRAQPFGTLRWSADYTRAKGGPPSRKTRNQHQLLECEVALESRNTVFADPQGSLVN